MVNFPLYRPPVFCRKATPTDSLDFLYGFDPSPGAFGETFGGPSDRGTDQNSYLGHANLPQRRERWWLSLGHIVGWG